MAKWKNECKKIMIDQNVDPRGWFKVIINVADLLNQNAHPGNQYFLTPLTVAKGDIGSISLLTDFNFNKNIYISRR